MRAAPAFQVTVRHFGLWRVACGALTALATTVTLLWSLRSTDPGPTFPVAVFSLGGCVLAVIATLLSWRPAAFCLRWDTQCWHLADMGNDLTNTELTVSGHLAVAIDLGPWMLLKFVPGNGMSKSKSKSKGMATRWLPVQHWGLGTRWHPLRCAIYNARPNNEATAVAAQH